MFERGSSTSTEVLSGLLEVLVTLDEAASDAERVDRLAALELGEVRGGGGAGPDHRGLRGVAGAGGPGVAAASA